MEAAVGLALLAIGWSTGNQGSSTTEPMGSDVHPGSSATLLASSEPGERNLADVASWTERMPVLHGSAHHGPGQAQFSWLVRCSLCASSLQGH